MLNEIIKVLKQNKFLDIKIESSKSIKVFTDKNRIQIMNDIAKLLRKYAARYISTPSGQSSIGHVETKEVKIYVKPIDKQGENRPGIKNETALIKTIKYYLRKNKKIDIRFHSNKKNKIFRNIVGVKHTGHITTAGQKADMVLVNHKGKIFPFSIKKDNAEIWGSVDGFWVPKAKKYLLKLMKQKKIKLFKRNNLFQLHPKVAFKATTEESREVIFGSDISENGLVIQKTFSKQDLTTQNGGKFLNVKCSHIIETLRDLDNKHKVWMHIRTDKCRNVPNFFPGLRIIASMEKALSSTVLKINA